MLLVLAGVLAAAAPAFADGKAFKSENNQTGGPQPGDGPGCGDGGCQPGCAGDSGAGPDPAPGQAPPGSVGAGAPASSGSTQAPGSHPIDVVKGREILSRTDLVVNGVYPIQLTRRYDNQSEYDSPLGYGWAWQFDHQLFEYPDGSVVVRNSCGYKIRFLSAGGGFAVEGTRQEELTSTGSGSYELRYPRGRRVRFDAEGRLSELLDASGNKLVFSYAPGGFKSLWGTSPFSIAPTVPTEVARLPQLTRIQEVLANSTVTGREVNFSYDAVTGRLETATDDNSRTVSYAHDLVSPDGNLEQVVGPSGIEDAYLYGDPLDRHNLTSSQLGQGTTPWVNAYDAQDRVTQQTRGDRVIALDYATPLTTVVTRTIKNAAGGTIGTAVDRFEYNTLGRLTKRVDALGNEFHFTRGTNGLLDVLEVYQKVGPNLVLQRRVDHPTYGLDKNLTKREVALSPTETITETWTYDDHWVASHQIVSSAAPTVFREEYTFERDAQDHPVRIASVKRMLSTGVFETTSFAYDANGQVTTVTPPPVTPGDGLTIARSYFTAGANVGMLQQVEVQINGTPDLHLKRTFSYDARDEIDIVTNARGFPADYDFDALGRIERFENALNEVTYFRYKGPSAVGSYESAPPGAFLSEVEVGTTAAQGEGQLRRLRYDAEGRLERVERKDANAWSTFMTYAYDSDDNPRLATDAEGRLTTFVYDGLARLTGSSDMAGNATGFAYDAEGNRTTVQDAKGRLTQFSYDDLNRLIQIDQTEESLTTKFAYDAAGNVARVTDPKLQETDYTYDALSRLTAVEQPLGQVVSYAYDGRGRLASTTNARGHVLRYAYQPWGGLDHADEFLNASATTPTKTVSYTFDNEGSIATVSDSTAPGGPLLYTYAYDALGRVDTTTAHYVPDYLPGVDRVLDSAYDRFGNRKQLDLQDDDGASTLTQAWTFDKLDRLVSAALAQGTTTYGYRANDELETITRASGVATTLAYFDHGPIDTITTRDSGSTLLHRLDYAVDSTLNVDTITETRGTGSGELFDYGYDGVDRLTSATNPASFELPATESYSYDPAGNRETPGSPSAYDYDANNRILVSPPGTTTYAFDADGNLQTKNAGLSTEERFTFDKTNRLIYWEKGSPTPTASASYVYDPFGRRIRKAANGTTTWFLWDGDVLAAEFDSTGTRTRRYTYDGGWAPAELVTKTGGTETAYAVTTDHLDTPRMLTNSTGVAVWRSSHESFGAAAVDPASTVTFNVRFPGQYFDAETGLHYNDFRVYDPSTGRYVSADPVGQYSSLARDRVAVSMHYPGGGVRNGPHDSGDFNLYAYARGNPILLADPLGLWSLTVTAFNGGWAGFGLSATIGSDDNGGFFDATAGVGVGAGFSYNPNGTSPIAAQCGDPASAWVGAGGALGAQFGPFSAGWSGFAGGALGGDPPSFGYTQQTAPDFGVGSWGLGLYGIGGIRVGASGL